MKGRLEASDGDGYVGFKFGKGYATDNTYKFEFRAQNKDTKAYTTVATQDFTVKEVANIEDID